MKTINKQKQIHWLWLSLLAFALTACADDGEEPAPLPNYSQVIQGTYLVEYSYVVRFGNEDFRLIDTVRVEVDRVSDTQVRMRQDNGLSFQATFVEEASDGAVFSILNGSNYNGEPIFPNDEDRAQQHGIFFYPNDPNNIEQQQIIYNIRIDGISHSCASFQFIP
ncbi:MAG: hypothetical protein ACFCUI_05645 [Bernardetiaceae bacterium]